MVSVFRDIGHVVCVGAHPDDVEIGAGGTVLKLLGAFPSSDFSFVVMTATSERAVEARRSVEALAPGRISLHLGGFRDGHLPYDRPGEAKEWLSAAVTTAPDLVLAPSLEDRHQDHRYVAELCWQLFRRSPILEYEIPKWEGDRPSANFFVSLGYQDMKAKVAHLMDNFTSQHDKPWYEPDVFEGMARLRGLEAGSTFAEGFTARKIIWL